jgi:ABC-2 type transport system ATP-binding protein
MTEPLQNAVETVNLRKTYKSQGGAPEKEALKGVTLAIPRGSIFGLLGPNGAGKSTFINILAGLVIKTSGTARIWGFDIDEHPRQARASIGVVPQELNIDPFFTPLEMLEIQAGLYGVPKAERRSMEILEAVGLADKKDAYARTLSGGMRRRLLVAKALVHTPPVLVLDEPTAGVDIELRKSLWDYVRKLNARGVTIVLTTHYLEEAEELCGRIAIVNHGDVVACDTTSALLARIDEKTLLVTPDRPLSAIPESLRARNGRTQLRPDGRLALAFSRAETRIGDLLDQVKAAGISIADLSTEESDLEDIFLQLTGAGPAAAQPGAGDTGGGKAGDADAAERPAEPAAASPACVDR